jgi:2-keto-4-pentenoate hydratase/2-oxohepta-3-ene-1,7-dioic acid hydratase in catechol pathway
MPTSDDSLEDMRFSHLFSPPSSQTPRFAVMVNAADGTVAGALFVDELLDEAPRDLQEFLESDAATQRRVRDTVSVAIKSGASLTPVTEFTVGPAVLRPPAIIAIGLNYADHAAELGLDIAASPTVFGLWPNSLAADGDTLTWPRTLSTAVDYEVELGVVIGQDVKNVSVEDALGSVFGYTVVNDITARDIQFRELQWIRCKSFDGFTPVGPVVVTADEVANPQALRLTAAVNGIVLQDANTSDMIRSVAELVSFLSQGNTVKAGTLISTGTPAGAGFSREPKILLEDGDTVIVSVESIGSVSTKCRVTA